MSTLKPVTLVELVQDKNIKVLGRNIFITIPAEWIVTGEDRLSYTTIVRIIECCREHHWNFDISSKIAVPLDSITKYLECEFLAPIPVGSQIIVQYHILEMKQRSYTIRFIVTDREGQNKHAVIKMISVFYDPQKRKATAPPRVVSDLLKALAKEEFK